MNAKSAVFLTALLVPTLLHSGWAEDQSVERSRVLPDKAFKAIVQEARKTIGSSLQKGEPRSMYFDLRVNALVIALAADNRLVKKDADPSAGALRDTALYLVEGLDMDYTGSKWMLRLTDMGPSDNRAVHAELAKRFASLERAADQQQDKLSRARPVRIRLSSRFTHDDVAVFFGGCGGRSGHKIESELVTLMGASTSMISERLEPIERMGYKIALVGELLRDHHSHSDLFKGGMADRRKQWVGMAMDLEQAAWELADSARSKDVEKAKTGINKVDNACVACHEKVGFRHSR
jgi:hypothetical protein